MPAFFYLDVAVTVLRLSPKRAYRKDKAILWKSK